MWFRLVHVLNKRRRMASIPMMVDALDRLTEMVLGLPPREGCDWCVVLAMEEEL